MPTIPAATPEVAIQNEYVTLVYYPDKKIVHHTFHKPVPSKDLRAILNGGTELLQKHGACKWLSDDRGNGPLSAEDTEWAMSDWSPRSIKAGWKFWALVVPESVKARMNLKEFVDLYFQKGLRIMVFTQLDEAMEWLESMA
jgi:hypothetical protein